MKGKWQTDAIFGHWGRIVWNNCVKKAGEMFKEELESLQKPSDEDINNIACHIYVNASNPDDKIEAYIKGFKACRDGLITKE